MKKILLIFLLLFFVADSYAEYVGGYGTHPSRLQYNTATFQYDADNDAWMSNKPIKQTGTNNYISFDNDAGLIELTGNDMIFSVTGDNKVGTKGFHHDSTLIGYWKFNKDYSDSSSNDYDMTAVGNVSAANKVLVLDGLTDYVYDNDSTEAFNFFGSSGAESNANMTICAWVYLIDKTESGGIVGKGNDPALSDRVFVFRHNSSGTKVQWYYHGAVNLAETGALDNDTWYFIVGTREWVDPNYVLKIYVNGQLIDTGNNTVNPPDGSTDAVVIGALTWSLNESLNGYIDEVRIYNRCLDAWEVKRLYRDDPEYP